MTGEVHPAAELFPLMSDDEIQALADDIREHGLHEAITTHEGLILDGRNRIRACALAGVEPRFVEWEGTGGSPTDYVVSLNLHRRHLTKSQWAMIAVDSRKLYESEARKRQGARTDLSTATEESPPPVETALRAAEAVGVGVNTVYEAARIQREAPDLAEEIRAGQTSVGTAIREITGTRRKRNYVSARDRHSELIKRADALVAICERWDREMTDTLAPPQARKQLTVLRKAREHLDEVIEAVEYRAATLHTFLGR